MASIFSYRVGGASWVEINVNDNQGGNDDCKSSGGHRQGKGNKP